MINQYFAEMNTDKSIRENYFSDFNFKGTMIEVGGATPDYLSMSKHFKLNGWRTIIIEPNPNFVRLHKKCGNEVYEYACSDNDSDNVKFQVVNWQGNKDYEGMGITDHSFSSISVKEGYLKKHNYADIHSIPHTEIMVNIRKLNTIIEEINLESIDFLSIDVEGWELEVLRGFDINKYRPKVILLENYLHDEEYNKFMLGFNYKLDMKIDYNYIYSPII